jgi:hypothetical protein
MPPPQDELLNFRLRMEVENMTVPAVELASSQYPLPIRTPEDELLLELMAEFEISLTSTIESETLREVSD